MTFWKRPKTVTLPANLIDEKYQPLPFFLKEWNDAV
jgi:hypothetical protein